MRGVYKDYHRISSEHKARMYQTLAQRAALGGSSGQLGLPLQKSQRPDLGHGLSSVALDLGEKAQRLEARYGFHDFHDPALGMDPQAYIKFMQLEASLETDSWLLTRAQVADILSLQDFVWHLPQLSWRAGLNYTKDDDQSQWGLLGGLGLARTVEDSWQGFALVVAQAQRENETRKSFLRPGLNLGLRRERGEKSWASAEVLLLDKELARGIWAWNFSLGDWVARPYIEMSEGEIGLRFKLARYF